MNLPKWLVDFYIRVTRESEKSCLKELTIDRNTEHYKLPKSVKFPRPIIKKEIGDLEVFEYPSDGKTNITLLYFHGGAYIHPFSIFHWKFLVKISKKTGCKIVAPNYLMMPKYTAATSNEITMKFYEEFCKTHDMKNVVIAGDSAGGGLSAVVIQQAIKRGLKVPSKAILISPWVDVTGGNPEKTKVDNMIHYKMVSVYGNAWQKGLKDKDPLASPLYGDMESFPKTDLWIGGNEVLYDDVISLYEKMKNAKVDVKLHYIKNEGHVFPLYPTKNGENAVNEIAEFILK